MIHSHFDTGLLAYELSFKKKRDLTGVVFACLAFSISQHKIYPVHFFLWLPQNTIFSLSGDVSHLGHVTLIFMHLGLLVL